MMLTQAVRRAAQTNPHAVAFIEGDRRQTWPQFTDRVARLGAGLRAAGVAPGERVALLGLNSMSYLEALYGIWWAGAVAVPMNTRWSAGEAAYALRDAEVSAVICDDTFAGMTGRILAEGLPVKIALHYGESGLSGLRSLEDVIAAATPGASTEAGLNDLAGIYYTGGTTGFPKGVMLSPLALWSSAISIALDQTLTRDVRYLHAAPMFHLADGCMTLAVSTVAGSHVFVPAFKPDAVAEAIQTHQVSHVLLVPTMIKMLLDWPGLAAADLSSLELIMYGASPIPESTLRAGMAAIPSCRFLQAYGQTELGPLATILPPQEHLGPGARLASAGRAGLCVDLKIVDEAGDECPPGEIGEVWVKGPNTMLGYWRRPEETARTLVDGWVRTGDAAVMDGDGFISIKDRLKDMIISGGENVFSAEVENAVASHPGVDAVAVIGVPDDQLGERVHAIILPRAGAVVTIEDIQAHCRALIAGYKCPRSIEMRQTPLPVSGAGKILKTELREPHWRDAGRQVH